MPNSDNLIYITSEEVIKRMKADLMNPPNRIEGSFASDNIQAVGKEVAKYYSYVNRLQEMHYAETAVGQYLDRKAEEVGVFRKEPTSARGYVTFKGKEGTRIPAGYKLLAGERGFHTLTYGVIPASGSLTMEVEADDEGIGGNIKEGQINGRLTGIPGLDSVSNDKEFTGGTELEDDEHLRERTLLRMRYPGTSGNQYHYMHRATEVAGVGRVKVFPVRDGPGTVKVSILDENQRVATEDLIGKVKYHIQHEGDRMGEALAPIGALLTVSTASEVPLDIKGKVVLADGLSVTLTTIAEVLRDDLQGYIDKEISYKGERLTVAKVIDILYGVDGVLDITELTVNGQNKSLSLKPEEVFVVRKVELS